VLRLRTLHAFAALPTTAHPSQALHRRRLVLLALLLIGLTLLGSTSVLHEGLSRLFTAVQAQVATHPIQGAVLFVLSAALGAMLAFVSSAVLVPVAIYAWGEETTFLLLWSGWLAGGMASYGIGRFLGRPILKRLTAVDQIEVYERRIGARASFPLVLLFQLAMPSEIPGYVLGLLRYPLVRYLAILALAEFPYAIGVTFLGGALMNGQMIRFGLVAFGGIVLLSYAFGHLHKLLERADEEGSAAIDAGVEQTPRTP
jgi:uncharacterized membrane protein YdjX (TVP38/TMEM64 family)